jgi:hypothetical protein
VLYDFCIARNDYRQAAAAQLALARRLRDEEPGAVDAVHAALSAPTHFQSTYSYLQCASLTQPTIETCCGQLIIRSWTAILTIRVLQASATVTNYIHAPVLSLHAGRQIGSSAGLHARRKNQSMCGICTALHVLTLCFNGDEDNHGLGSIIKSVSLACSRPH